MQLCQARQKRGQIGGHRFGYRERAVVKTTVPLGYNLQTLDSSVGGGCSEENVLIDTGRPLEVAKPYGARLSELGNAVRSPLGELSIPESCSRVEVSNVEGFQATQSSDRVLELGRAAYVAEKFLLVGRRAILSLVVDGDTPIPLRVEQLVGSDDHMAEVVTEAGVRDVLERLQGRRGHHELFLAEKLVCELVEQLVIDQFASRSKCAKVGRG